MPAALTAQAELADERAVALEVVLLEVVEEATAAADEHQQAAARMVVVLVLAQMLGQVIDPMREQRHLDLGLAGVVLVLAEPRDDVALFLCGHAHVRWCRVAAVTRSRPPCLAAQAASPPTRWSRERALRGGARSRRRRAASARSAPRRSRSGARRGCDPR